MDLAGYVVNAVLVESRSVKEVLRAHDISRSWLYELIARYRADGRRGAAARSRSGPAPHRRGCPPAIEDEIVALRKELAELGSTPAPTPSTTTCCAVDRRRRRRCLRWPPSGGSCPGVASSCPSPRSGPRAPGGASRPSCPTSAGRPTPPTGPSPTAPTSRSSTCSTTTPGCSSPPGPSSRPRPPTWSRPSTKAPPSMGLPASMLTDNGAIFTAESRHGTCAIELELLSLGIDYKHSRPYHPQTCGKVERFHQTLKSWLAKQRRPPPSPSCKPSSTASPPTTTPSDPTGPSAGAPPPRPSPPAPRPHPRRPGITVPAQHRVRRDRIDTAATSPCATSPTAAPRRRPRLRRHPRPAPRRRPRRARHHRRRRTARQFTIDPTKTYQPQKRPGQHA